MTVQVREFTTEGHRLLVESPYSPAEVAKLAGVARQRVSEWRSGRKRPDAEARAALERAINIPARTWEAPPARREPTPGPGASPPAAPTSPAQDASGKATGVPLDLEGVDLAGLGLEGLAGLVLRFRALEPTLPPRDRVTALQSEARVLQMHETLRQKAADAREEYLASSEFLAEVRALVAVVPPPAAELRSHLGRLGVVLPAPPSPATAAGDPPSTVDDVDELLHELETARGFRVAKEPALALAHVLGLGLDEHADAIAALVVDDSPRTARLLSLLEGADERIIRSALERQMATRDALALPQEARAVVAELLHALGHEDLSADDRRRAWSLSVAPALDALLGAKYAAELAASRVTWPSSKYAADPVGHCIDVQGFAPTGRQIEICEAVRDHDRVAIPSGRKTGKSRILAALALWHFSQHDDATVVCVAPSERQIAEVVWYDLVGLFHASGRCLACVTRDPDGPRPCPHSTPVDGELSASVRTGLRAGQRRIIGLAPKSAENARGISGPHQLWLIDESPGVSRAIYEAADGNRAAGAKLVVAGQPTSRATWFFDACERLGFHTIRIASTD